MERYSSSPLCDRLLCLNPISTQLSLNPEVCTGLAAFWPSFTLPGFRAAGGLLYLSANVAGNVSIAQAGLASNVTDLVQQPHDSSSRSLLTAFNATTLQVISWVEHATCKPSPMAIELHRSSLSP